MNMPAKMTREMLDMQPRVSLAADGARGILIARPAISRAFRAVNASRVATLIARAVECVAPGRPAARELEIIVTVGEGLRNREIGDRLGLTENTVKWRVQQIYTKLGVDLRVHAVDRARQLGMSA